MNSHQLRSAAEDEPVSTEADRNHDRLGLRDSGNTRELTEAVLSRLDDVRAAAQHRHTPARENRMYTKTADVPPGGSNKPIYAAIHANFTPASVGIFKISRYDDDSPIHLVT